MARPMHVAEMKLTELNRSATGEMRCVHSRRKVACDPDTMDVLRRTVENNRELFEKCNGIFYVVFDVFTDKHGDRIIDHLFNVAPTIKDAITRASDGFQPVEGSNNRSSDSDDAQANVKNVMTPPVSYRYQEEEAECAPETPRSRTVQENDGISNCEAPFACVSSEPIAILPSLKDFVTRRNKEFPMSDAKTPVEANRLAMSNALQARLDFLDFRLQAPSQRRMLRDVFGVDRVTDQCSTQEDIPNMDDLSVRLGASSINDYHRDGTLSSANVSSVHNSIDTTTSVATNSESGTQKEVPEFYKDNGIGMTHVEARQLMNSKFYDKEWYKPSTGGYPFAAQGVVLKSSTERGMINIYTNRIGMITVPDHPDREGLFFAYFLVEAPDVFKGFEFDNLPNSLRSSKFVQKNGNFALELRGFALLSYGNRDDSDSEWQAWNDGIGLMRVIEGASRIHKRKLEGWQPTCDIITFVANFESNRFMIKTISSVSDREEHQSKGWPTKALFISDLMYQDTRAGGEIVFSSNKLGDYVTAEGRHIGSLKGKITPIQGVNYSGVVVPRYNGYSRHWAGICIMEREIWLTNEKMKRVRRELPDLAGPSSVNDMPSVPFFEPTSVQNSVPTVVPKVTKPTMAATRTVPNFARQMAQPSTSTQSSSRVSFTVRPQTTPQQLTTSRFEEQFSDDDW